MYIYSRNGIREESVSPALREREAEKQKQEPPLYYGITMAY